MASSVPFVVDGAAIQFSPSQEDTYFCCFFSPAPCILGPSPHWSGIDHLMGKREIRCFGAKMIGMSSPNI
jgi:hypothetical protein